VAEHRGIIVCTTATIGPDPHVRPSPVSLDPVPRLLAGPWLLAWIWGVFTGCAAHKNVPQRSEKLANGRHLENHGS
jgi:hypothetical protein